ncbi:helix-turn-helix domain-containing protein [Streptosporangium sp. NPDC003464]
MDDRTGLFTIGQLARRTALPVRTVRFWSDLGIVPPTCRSAGGYRLYDVAAVARLDLVRTLREPGLDLETVRRILRRQGTVAEIAGAHADVLDAVIRVLHLRRAVLRSVARRGSTTEEMRLMHRLARMSAQERQARGLVCVRRVPAPAAAERCRWLVSGPTDPDRPGSSARVCIGSDLLRPVKGSAPAFPAVAGPALVSGAGP